jgi:hypothetical protein
MFRLSRGPSYEQETGKGTASGSSIPLRSDGNGPIGYVGSLPRLVFGRQEAEIDLLVRFTGIDCDAPHPIPHAQT